MASQIPVQVLFHLSPIRNEFRIRNDGLRISNDARVQGKIWLCLGSHLQYVAEHLMSRDKLKKQVYTVLQVHRAVLAGQLKFCGRPGICYVEADISREKLRIAGRMYVDLLGARRIQFDTSSK